MKKVFLIGAMVTLLLTACGGETTDSESSTETSSSTTETIEIEDLTGRILTVTPGSYKKIVCVGAGALRFYSYVGDVSLLSGVEDIDNPTARANGSGIYFNNVPRPYYDAFKESFDGLTSAGIGGPANQRPELEKLLACDPDLIISEYSSDYASQMEEAIGCPVFNVAYGSKTVFDDNAKNSITKLGQILDKEEKANALVSYINQAEEDLNSRTSEISSDVKAYAAGIGNWGQTDYLASHFNFPLFNVNNITNVLTGSGIEGVGQASITVDNFVSISDKIDYLFIDAAGLSKTLSEFEADNTIFDFVKAVENGNVFLTLPYNAYYTNLEVALIDAYHIGKSVYPEAFSDIDIKTKSDEIFTQFLGKEMYEEEIALSGAYGGLQKINDLKSWLNSYLG